MLFAPKIKYPIKIGGGCDSEPVCAVVFVHGLGGGRETWDEFSSFANKKWNGCRVDLWCYHPYNEDSFSEKTTKVIGVIPLLKKPIRFLVRVIKGESIDTLAKGLWSYTEQNCYKYQNVIIVGHSMGGLVSKRAIVSLLEKTHTTQNIVKLITYATPHEGSKIAKYLGITIQIRQMNFFKSSFLNILTEKWYNYSAENHVNPTYVVATKDRIVNESSASGTDANPHIVYAVGQSHSSVILPKNVDDISYATFTKALRTYCCDVNLTDQGALDDFLMDEELDFNESLDE